MRPHCAFRLLQRGDRQRPLHLLQVPHPGHPPLPVLAERVPLHGEWGGGHVVLRCPAPRSLTGPCLLLCPSGSSSTGTGSAASPLGSSSLRSPGLSSTSTSPTHTSKAADVVLLGGDLNMHPEDVGIRLLRGWTGLRDAFAEATRFEGCEDGCTLVPNNCFTVKAELLPFPLGIRIDYILYKAISSFTVKCEELKTTTGTAPGMDIPFSDHEAVMATLHIQRQGQAVGAGLGAAELTLVDVVTEARTEVGVGLRAAQRQRYSAGRMAVLAALLLLLQAVAALGVLAGLAAGQPFPKLSFSLLAFLAVGVLLLSTGLHLFHTMEVKMLQGTEEQMRMALRVLQERLRDG
uniref:Endonuclease/exonuclease/phosphatase domain-containing protein n=1 Tax=Falco tinnunculus TaxID=100819 RepID=A0A8C4V2I7_FALTI